MSIVRHRLSYEIDPAAYLKELEYKRYLMKKLIKHKNLLLYDFQHLKHITWELNNYKDTSHYSEKINDYIIKSISEKKHLVRDQDIEILIKSLQDQVLGFDMNDLFKQYSYYKFQ